MATKNNLENIIERIEMIARNIEVAADELRREVFDRYDQIGKSRSEQKRAASVVNGRKGGRPPKAVTELKRLLGQPDCENRAELEKEMQEILEEWRTRRARAGHLD